MNMQMVLLQNEKGSWSLDHAYPTSSLPQRKKDTRTCTHKAHRARERERERATSPGLPCLQCRSSLPTRSPFFCALPPLLYADGSTLHALSPLLSLSVADHATGLERDDANEPAEAACRPHLAPCASSETRTHADETDSPPL